ncbi:MAG: Flp family type IVb pilin [Bacillota bacterium]
MKELVQRLIKGEEGQGMAEYGLILALIAVIAIAGLIVLGPKIRDKFIQVSNNL